MTRTFTPAQIGQMRRDAKRLAREGLLTYAQALDRIAQGVGFQNWSLVVKHTAELPSAEQGAAPAASDAAASSAVQEMRAALFPHMRMQVSARERELIVAIAKRYDTIAQTLGIAVHRLSVMMDLEACHCNGCPLDLVALLEAPRDEDVVHDVAGIGQHLDRDTGKLQDYFWPRYAMPQPAGQEAS